MVRLVPLGNDLLLDPSKDSAESVLRLYCLRLGAASLTAHGVAQIVKSPTLIAARAGEQLVLDRFSSADPRRLFVVDLQLTGPVATLFLEAFVQVRVVTLSDDEPALRLAIAIIESELDSPRCGHPALLNRAGDILFIGLLRYLVAHSGDEGKGLFSALADAKIAKALVAMHAKPSFGWRLESLAQEAGMSRTAFATKFREVMGRPPGKYLSAIRLSIAQRAVHSGRGLKEAARLAGYENSSALSRALAKSS